MLRYHVAFYPSHAPREMVVAEAFDFPGAVTQGFGMPDARLMIASALEDLAQALLEDGKPLPVPSDDAHSPDADLIELAPLSVHAGTIGKTARIAGPPPPARVSQPAAGYQPAPPPAVRRQRALQFGASCKERAAMRHFEC